MSSDSFRKRTYSQCRHWIHVDKIMGRRFWRQPNVAPMFARQMASQQTRRIHSMLFHCWASVEDGVPTLKQLWVNVPFLLGLRHRAGVWLYLTGVVWLVFILNKPL